MSEKKRILFSLPKKKLFFRPFDLMGSRCIYIFFLVLFYNFIYGYIYRYVSMAWTIEHYNWCDDHSMNITCKLVGTQWPAEEIEMKKRIWIKEHIEYVYTHKIIWFSSNAQSVAAQLTLFLHPDDQPDPYYYTHTHIHVYMNTRSNSNRSKPTIRYGARWWAHQECKSI